MPNDNKEHTNNDNREEIIVSERNEKQTFSRIPPRDSSEKYVKGQKKEE